MSAARTIRPSDLARPVHYREDYLRELHQRQHLERRVESLELERDALLLRLQQAKAENERLKAAACPPRVQQVTLARGAA